MSVLHLFPKALSIHTVAALQKKQNRLESFVQLQIEIPAFAGMDQILLTPKSLYFINYFLLICCEFNQIVYVKVTGSKKPQNLFLYR